MRPATADPAAPSHIRPAPPTARGGRPALWSLHSHALPLVGQSDAVFADVLDDDLAVDRLTLHELSTAEKHDPIPGIGRPHQHLELELLHGLAELGADLRHRRC